MLSYRNPYIVAHACKLDKTGVRNFAEQNTFHSKQDDRTRYFSCGVDERNNVVKRVMKYLL